MCIRDSFNIAPGYEAEDFMRNGNRINIEVGVNFAPGLQGANMFTVGDPIDSGAFRIVVPEGEASSLCLIGMAIVLLKTRRRLRHSR